MSAPSGTSSRVLLPVAALLLLAGVVLLALGAAGTAGRATGDLVGFRPGQQVTVPEEGMSVWSRSAQTRQATVCTADGAPLLRPVQDFSTEVAGQRFHEVARTPDGMAGTFTVECDTTDAVYAGPYGPATVAPGLMGTPGLVVGAVLTPLGLLALVLALLDRRRQRPAAEHGPDPGDYELTPTGGQTPYSSPYAAPQAPVPGTGPGYGGWAPQAQGPGAPAADPGPARSGGATGGADDEGLPPAPVSTGHDTDQQDRQSGAGREPHGPRYDLPPPS